MSGGPEFNDWDHQENDIEVGDFLNFISSEIQGIRSETARPGWTAWALVAAIASVLWLIIQAVEGGNTQLVGVSEWFLGFLFIGLGGWLMFSQIEAPPQFKSGDARYQLSNQMLSVRRGALFHILITSLLVLALVINTRHVLTVDRQIVAFVITASVILGLVLVLIFSLISYPLADSATPRIAIALFFLIGMAAVWVGYGYVANRLSPGSGPPNYEELRLAALLFVLVALIQILLRSRRVPPLLGSLEETRRALALGRYGLATAIRQTDLALKGLRVSDVLQEDIDEFLTLSRRFNQETSEAMWKVQILKSMLETGNYREVDKSDPNIQIIESLMDSIKSKVEKGGKTISSISPVVDSIAKKSLRLLPRAEQARPELVEIAEMMEEQNRLNRDHLNRLRSAMDELPLDSESSEQVHSPT